MKTLLLAKTSIFLLLLLIIFSTVWADNVIVTKHNLSVSGPGITKASTESEICIFCHTPHAAKHDIPLWNRPFSTETYITYASSSLDAVVGQPSGHSKLCLSCHDGSLAIGGITNASGSGFGSSIQMTNTAPGGTMRYGTNNQPENQFTSDTRRIGTNLSNDHPVSFVLDYDVYTNDGELIHPDKLGFGSKGNPFKNSKKSVALYPLGFTGTNNAVQCTSCHNPHGQNFTNKPDKETTVEDMYPKFLRTNPYNNYPKEGEDQICLSCHIKPGWKGSIHERSTLSYRPQGVPGIDPWVNANLTVSKAGCLNCHDPHTTQGADRLHRNGASNEDGSGTPAIENTCFQCHISSTQKIPSLNSGNTEDRFIPNIPINKEIKPEFDKRGNGGSAMPLSINWNGNSTNGIHQVAFISYKNTKKENNLFDPSDCNRFPDNCNTPEENVHVECVDCHNPHQVTSPGNSVDIDPTPNTNGGRLEGMKGIQVNGEAVGFNVDPAAGDPNRDPYVFEICFRCHGDTYDKNMSRPDNNNPPTIILPRPNSNKRLEFDPDTRSKSYTNGGGYIDMPCDNNPTCNRAYHPVAVPGRNMSKALCNQLKENLGLNCDDPKSTLGSLTIVCTDCHNNNLTGEGTTYMYEGLTAFRPLYGGPVTQSNLRSSDLNLGYNFSAIGPVGPHGSTNWRILRGNFDANLGTAGSAPFPNWDPTRFQLCFNCHDSRGFIDSDGIIDRDDQFTNFRQAQGYPGCASPTSNLHAVHLTNVSGFGGWNYLANMYTTCANCHYNVHSNAEQVNTIYGDGTGGALPPDGDTHLLNFSPQVQAADFSRPRWWNSTNNFPFTNVMRCNLTCHGVTMGGGGGFGGGPVDAWYTRYDS